MKKFLSVLMVLIFMFSIPVNAAPKKYNKPTKFKDTKVEKKVDIDLKATSKLIEGKLVYTLTAVVPKRGSSIDFKWVVNEKVMSASTNSAKTKTLIKNKPTYSYKAGKYTITTTFIPEAEKKYTITFTATMTAGKSKVVFAGSKSIDLNGNAVNNSSKSKYAFNIDDLPSSIAAEDDINIPVTLKATDVKTSGYDKVRINVSYTAPHDGVLNLWATDSDEHTWDVAKIGYWGPSTGFPISKDYNTTTNFTARFSIKGTYSITLKLYDLESKNVITSRTININVGSPKDTITTPYVFKIGGLPSTIEVEHNITVPVTLKATNINTTEYDDVMTKISYTAPDDGILNLWTIEDGDTIDAAKQGYWGPSDGFYISEDYNKTTNFTARFDVEGTYKIKLELIDLDDDSVITSKTIVIYVGTPTAGEKSIYGFSIGTLPTTIKAANDVNIPITLKATDINVLGYDNVITKISYTAPHDGVLNLWTSASKTKDAAALGYWGPSTGFSISKDYSATTNFVARFSTSGVYTIKLKLVNHNNNTVIASKTFNVNVGTSTGSIKDFTIKKLLVKPYDIPNNIYTLSVSSILVNYENGSTQVTLNPVYSIGVVSFDNLTKSDYSKTFKVTYKGLTQTFTLTGEEILDLL